ncbi:MAG: dienelactone hydrolase family protein [Myxococcota bacterium]|nr:dienelactone hydrolase family protein [Myxococcota bacterium]
MILLTLLACPQPEPVDSSTPVTDYSAAGPYQAGHTQLVLDDAERSLTVEIWYPTQAVGQPSSITQSFLTPAQGEQWATLMAEAPTGCVNDAPTATLDAEPVGGPLPLLLMSHCHECARFSTFSVAEHLASWGFVVAAPDHVGNTMWEMLAETGQLPLNESTLALRLSDQQRVLDQVLATPPLELEIDAQRIGAIGHSFGSVTSGYLLQEDARVSAALGLAAPMENPLLKGVVVSELDAPIAILLAQEDGSITELGNTLIRSNIEEAGGPAWMLELPDAGHWSVSDLLGVHPSFEDGCGSGERHEDGSAFDFIEPAQGRGAAGQLAAAFFTETLLGEDGAIQGQQFAGEVTLGGTLSSAE